MAAGGDIGNDTDRGAAGGGELVLADVDVDVDGESEFNGELLFSADDAEFDESAYPVRH